MSDELILKSTSNNVLTLTLNRPKALNALNVPLLEALSAAIDEVEQTPEIKAIVLTGTGKAFVAGADIAQMVDFSDDQAWRFAAWGQRLFSRLEKLSIPVIAAINGFALGGGCELAMAADILIASDKAKFGQPEVNLGVIPGFGGTQRLQRLVGPQLAMDLVLTGRIIKADEAKDIGLVARVVPADDLLAEAQKCAELIASKGPIAVAHAKRVIRDGGDTTLDHSMMLEAEAFAACFRTEDRKEGMQAFLEKRAADFKGA